MFIESMLSARRLHALRAILLCISTLTFFGRPEVSASASAPVAAEDRVVLVTGEALIGRVVARDAEHITLEHPALGILRIAVGQISYVEPIADAAEGADVAPAAVPAPMDATHATSAGSATIADASLSLRDEAQPEPTPEVPAVKWSGRFELGANATSGNSDTTSVYAAFGVKREAGLGTFTGDLNYRLATDNGETTTNRFFNVARFERLLAEGSRWSWFASTSQEVDEFKDYDFRLSGSGGFSYDAIREDRQTLKLYAGAGVAREFGGSQDNLNPFALLGAAYTRKINSRVSFAASGEFEPRLDDFGEYRLRGKSKLDVDLNDNGSLKLSLGVEDEFNSDPGDAKKNDFYFFAAIVYAF